MSMTIEEKREKTRLRNIAWRKNNPQKYLRAAAKYRHSHPDKLAEYKLKTRFGLTAEHYDKMLVFQNHRCAICGNEEIALHNRSKKVQKLAVDHCHLTGKIRGLLCQECNRGIGKFHDNISRLQGAIKYLSQYRNDSDEILQKKIKK